jgi:hypothetical protein
VPEIAKAIIKADRKVLDAAYARIQKVRQKLSAPAPFSMEAFKQLDKETAQMRDQVFSNQKALV